MWLAFNRSIGILTIDLCSRRCHHQCHHWMQRGTYKPWFSDERSINYHWCHSGGLSRCETGGMLERVSHFILPLWKEGCLRFPSTRSTSTNQLCANESLTSIQDSYGTLSVSGVEKLVSDIIAGTASLPKNVTCSDCTKASYNIIKASFPEYITSDVSNNFSTECGSSFVGEFSVYTSLTICSFIDGTNPSDVSQTASGSASGSSTTKSGAAHLFHFTTALAGPVSALLIVSSIFVAFA